MIPLAKLASFLHITAQFSSSAHLYIKPAVERDKNTILGSTACCPRFLAGFNLLQSSFSVQIVQKRQTAKPDAELFIHICRDHMVVYKRMSSVTCISILPFTAQTTVNCPVHLSHAFLYHANFKHIHKKNRNCVPFIRNVYVSKGVDLHAQQGLSQMPASCLLHRLFNIVF